MKKIEDIEKVFEESQKAKYFLEVLEWIAKLKNKIQEAGKSLKDKTPQEIADILQNDPPKVTLALDVFQCQNLIENLGKVYELSDQLEVKTQIIDDIEKLFNEAQKAYYKAGKQDEKLREVAKIFRWTDGSGKRRSKINDHRFFCKFLELTHGKLDPETITLSKPLSKTEAYKFLAKEYELNSLDAAKKKIQRIKKKFEEDSKKVDLSQ